MAKILPVLTSKGSGWISDPTTIAERLLYTAYATDNIQSRLFGNKIISMADIFRKGNNSLEETIQELEEGLSGMYERVFEEGVEVSVTMEEKVSNATFTALISVQFVEQGKAYDLRNILSVNNNVAKSIIRHVNG